MAKIIEPAVDSVWEHSNGQRFRVIAAGMDHIHLQALATGRRHWVTNQGLQRKYTWIADPIDGNEDGEDASSSGE